MATKTKQPRDAKGRFMSSKTTTKSSKGKKTTMSKGRSSSTSTKTTAGNKTAAKKGTGSSKTNQPKKKTPTKVITIHNVHLLDASYSMSFGKSPGDPNSKYISALRGINAEQERLKASKDKSIKYTQSVFEFRGSVSSTPSGESCVINTHYMMRDIKNTNPIVGRGAFGNTPLNEAVGKTITSFLSSKKKDEKVALTIFTDGEENWSKGEFASKIALSKLIKLAESEGFTVTFMGTEQDTNKVIKDLGISHTNTLVHDNTPEGVGATYFTRSTQMEKYTQKLKKGKNVTFGFFSDEKK